MSSKFNTRKGPGAEDANNHLSALLNEWLTTQGPSPIFQTCASCTHMTKENRPAFCTKYNMTPPVAVILSGCPSYNDENDIPF